MNACHHLRGWWPQVINGPGQGGNKVSVDGSGISFSLSFFFLLFFSLLLILGKMGGGDEKKRMGI